MRELKVGDRFIHATYGQDIVCTVVRLEEDGEGSTVKFYITENGRAGHFYQSSLFVVRILTDEPASTTLDAPESIYPPWPSPASTERE